MYRDEFAKWIAEASPGLLVICAAMGRLLFDQVVADLSQEISAELGLSPARDKEVLATP